MPISETPKVKFLEGDSTTNKIGTGAQIPIFICATKNTTPLPGIGKFSKYSETQAATNLTENPGLISKTDDAQDTSAFVLGVLEDFFEESLKVNSNDIGVPYIYFKDMGTTALTGNAAWTTAMQEIKAKRDVQVEAYLFQSTDTTANIKAILTSALARVKEDNKKGNPRIIYYTIEGADKAKLKELTNATTGIQDSRIAPIMPEKMGKILAKICCTPHYEEPGYTEFRTIPAGTLTQRTDEEELELQNAGIICARDEITNSSIHPKINLAVSSAFAADENSRANDCLLHHRRNTDQLIREAVDIVYPQLKRNETQVNITQVQADLDVLVREKIRAGHMKTGTFMDVIESEENPFKLIITGKSLPVNSSDLIEMTVYVGE